MLLVRRHRENSLKSHLNPSRASHLHLQPGAVGKQKTLLTRRGVLPDFSKLVELIGAGAIQVAWAKERDMDKLEAIAGIFS